MTETLWSTVIARRQNIFALLGDAEHIEESGDTRTRVLHAAIALFAEYEYGACTMKRLAAAVGVKAPALYNHFASKEQILAEALSLSLKEFFGFVLGPLDDVAPKDWLELIVRRHVICQLETIESSQASDLLLRPKMLAQNLPEANLDRLKDAEREYVGLLRDLIRASARHAMSQDESMITARAIAAICEHASVWYSPSGHLTPDDVADITWRLASRMLGLDADGEVSTPPTA